MRCDMKSERVYFGMNKPAPIDYKQQTDGFAEVWLYRNFKQDDDGWYADGIFLKTMMSEEEVAANADEYFAEPAPEVTTEDLMDAINILSEIVLGGEAE